MRAVVSVATGRYVPGLQRLRSAVLDQCNFIGWMNELPRECPPHSEKPYAFKAHALHAASLLGYTTLLWADACILPIRPMETLFAEIERKGYWICRNGFSNAEWTAPEAYKDLCVTPEENEDIEHVVATAFGVDLRFDIGREILSEYLRLARTNAFCGPWRYREGTRASRGDKEISGHRHDQTALSVIAHRLGCAMTDPPMFFAYRGGENQTTVIVADSHYSR
jgi:hypothetical protein